MIKLPEGRRCYNAGKISGLNYLGALAKFRKFDEQIYIETGLHPVNPMVHGLKPCRPWWMHMLYDLHLMLRCDAVFFQPDWVESRGAKIEHFVAELFGMEIYHYRKSHDGKSKSKETKEIQ